MDSIRLEGQIDDNHRITADVPGSIPPGRVTVWITPAEAGEDSAGGDWANGIAREWASELSDARQDIYTAADGDTLELSVLTFDNSIGDSGVSQ